MISGSMDTSIKVWDLRNPSIPLVSTFTLNSMLLIFIIVIVVVLFLFLFDVLCFMLLTLCHTYTYTHIHNSVFSKHMLNECAVSSSIRTSWSAVVMTTLSRCLRIFSSHLDRFETQAQNIVQIWDWQTGRCEATLLGHTASARCLHFTHQWLASGSLDKTIKVWDFSNPSAFNRTGN